MKALYPLALAACLLAAGPGAAEPKASGAAGLSSEALAAGSWFINLGPGSRDELRFFLIAPEDAGHLYVRRFLTPAFYLDALSGGELKVLLWPETKHRTLSFSEDGTSLLRETSPVRLEYRRSSAPPGAAPSYEGDWEVVGPAMTLSIRACEKAAWKLAMYFPGDPLSAIPMGYYPLRPVGDGVYRSSAAFLDSSIELEYDPLSDALVIRPLGKERPLAAELYEPVRAWRGK
jgi:hypothetical protein